MRKIISLGLVLAITSLLAGCSAIDPYPDDAYYKNIYVINPYAIHTDTLTLGGIDYTSANISAGGSGNVTSITAGTGITLTPNPIISSGTVAIDNTVVTLTGAQSLTNKQLLMNNGDAIQWNTFAGVSQDTLNLLASNILQLTNPSGAVQILGGSINLNYNIDEEIYLWGGTKGTGRNLVLYSGYATALDTLRDSPTLDMAASYWDGGAAVGWETTFEDYMIDAAPHSRLVVSTNDTAIIGFDNDVGIPSTILFGDLDANSFSIKDTDLVDILQIGVEPSSTVDKAGIYAWDYIPDNTTLGIYTETPVQVALGLASQNRMPVRWNGATYYLLAEQTSFRTPIVGTVEPTVGEGAVEGMIFLNAVTDTWEKCTSISPVTWDTLSLGGATAWGSITGNITYQTDLNTALANKELTVNKGVANGYAPLDSNVKVPIEDLGTLPKGGSSLYLRSDQTWDTPTASAAWGNIIGTLSSQTDLQGALDGKLSTVTGANLDNIFLSNGLLKRTGVATYTVDASNYLTSFTELDPIYGASVASSIQSSNITAWNNKIGTELDPVFGDSVAHGIVSGDITNWNNKLSSITGSGLDNVFSSTGLLKRTGTATYTVDANAYLTANQNITLSGDLSGSGTTSISGTVTGIQGKAITLATGFLKYSGSAWTFDSSTYVTSGVTTLSSLASIGTITTGTWNGAVLLGQYGGTGVANTGKTLTLTGTSSSTYNYIARGKLIAPVATSGTGETLLFKLAIPASSVAVGDTFRVFLYGNSSSTGTLIFRVRVGANGTTGDNQAWISTTSAAQVANAWAGIDVAVTVRSATTVQASGHASAGAVLLPQLIGAPATAAIASTATWYIDIDCTCSSGTFTAQNAVITNE